MCPGETDGAYRLDRGPGGARLGRFAALEATPGIAHAVTTRDAPDVQRVRGDRAAAADEAARMIGLSAAAVAEQVHDAHVVCVHRPGLAGKADGLVTRAPGLAVACLSADCPLVLVAARDGRAVGVAHASWRGTVGEVSARLVETLADRCDVAPGELVACICPSAGPCCYEVGGEVLQAAVDALGLVAERFFRELRAGKYAFDLWAANRHQLLAAGVPASHVHAAGVCTICHSRTYPSHRAEGPPAGRFLALIGRRP